MRMVTAVKLSCEHEFTKQSMDLQAEVYSLVTDLFWVLNSSRSSLSYFALHNEPDVFSWWKIWTAGRFVQHLDSSTTKPCCCNRCSMWFSIVLLKYGRPFLKKTSSGRCISETCKYLSVNTFQHWWCQICISLTTEQFPTAPQSILK